MRSHHIVYPRLSDHCSSCSQAPPKFVHEEGDEYVDKPPVTAIILAVVLLITGVILLVLGALHLRGHIYSKDGAVRQCQSVSQLQHQACKSHRQNACDTGSGLDHLGHPDFSAR